MKKNPLMIIIAFAVLALCSAIILIYIKTKYKSPDYVIENQDIYIIDIHNHDAGKYNKSLLIWNQYDIERIVLFGNISEPGALETDKKAWEAYAKHPDRFYPFFAAIDAYSEDCLKYSKDMLEQGYYGIGEIYAASQYSPFSSIAIWKSRHAMDGYMPQLYELCGEYNAPLLLHIDPPTEYHINMLKKALETYPNTDFILAHGNVYNSSELLEDLLVTYDNIYIDLFAGYTANPECGQTIEEYAKIIKKYPDRFMVSSDSAYAITYEDAYKSIYKLFELLDEDCIGKIAHLNFEKLMEQQPITETQIEIIKEICKEKELEIDFSSFSKQDANEFIFSNK